jgi:hypothetical protein
VPLGGQGRQFPDRVDVAGPAVGKLIAAIVLAEHGVGPPPQVSQPRMVSVAIQADPERSGRPARGGCLQRVSNGLGQILEPGGQVQVGAKPCLVEPFVRWQLPGEGTHLLLDLLVQEECTTAQLN